MSLRNGELLGGVGKKITPEKQKINFTDEETEGQRT